MAYSRPAKRRKLEGPSCSSLICRGRIKSYFISLCSSSEEILERQLIIQSRNIFCNWESSRGPLCRPGFQDNRRVWNTCMATPFSISRRSCTENSLWLLDVPMFRLSVVFLTSLTVVTFKVCVLVCCATVWWFVVQLYDGLLCNCMMVCCATAW